MSLPSRVVVGMMILKLFVCAAVLSAQPSGPATPPDIHQSLQGLADQPPSHMGFVFDRSLLQAAQQLLQSDGMTPERAAAALTSISYDNYRYRQPAVYTPESMTPILNAYHAAGWKHLVDSHEKAYTARDGSTAHHTQVTDLWLHFTGSDIDGLTVLTRGERNVNVIQVACDLRPLDLIHLSGHFGIPKVDPSAVMVPDPKDR